MIFEIGQSYTNNIGTYIVLSIHNDVMNVKYSDGHEQILSIIRQSRIYENRAIAKSIEQNFTLHTSKTKSAVEYKSSDYWTLGFLLDRLIYLQFKVMYDKQEEANVNYFNITGQELNTAKIGIFYYPKGTNQWGNQGVITFRANDSELLLLKFKGKPSLISNSQNTYIVSDIKFFYFMLKNNFKTGKIQDTTNITNNIPEIHKEHFNKGYIYAQGR
jgi:hypothetical protein